MWEIQLKAAYAAVSNKLYFESATGLLPSEFKKNNIHTPVILEQILCYWLTLHSSLYKNMSLGFFFIGIIKIMVNLNHILID